MRSRKAAIVAVSMLAPLPAPAQEMGNPRAGLALAREVCAPCHAILAGETQSPNARAPSFEAIARTPGMTSTALSVALRTSHETMPNLMFEADELQDVIAYIRSVNRPR